MTLGEIITASIAGVALIVACLARLDSKESAEAAQKSAEAAQRANDLLARQVDLATDEQKRKVEKEREESSPYFNWRGGQDAPVVGTRERDFQNLGGDVMDLAIQTDSSDISAVIYPENILQHNGVGSIKFAGKTGTLSRTIGFRISCKTKIGDRWEKAYKMMEGRDLKIVEA